MDMRYFLRYERKPEKQGKMMVNAEYLYDAINLHVAQIEKNSSEFNSGLY